MSISADFVAKMHEFLHATPELNGHGCEEHHVYYWMAILDMD